MRSCILSLAILAAAGCAPVAPQLDSRFGASVRTLMHQQARPQADAHAHADAQAGNASFDAAAAHGALARYRQSFHAPAPAPRAVLGASGGGHGGN